LPITFWAFATLAVLDEPLCNAISSASLKRIPEYELLDLSNTAWSLALLGVSDGPLLEAIASSAIRLISEASEQTRLGNPWTLLWSMWRLHEQRLERPIFENFASLGLMVELLSCQTIILGNEWRRLNTVEVNLETAMEKVCFWTLGKENEPPFHDTGSPIVGIGGMMG